jgi:hypothetical protein
MYDVINNHMIESIVATQSLPVAVANYPGNNGIDLWQAGTNLPNVAIFIADIDVGAAGTVDIVVQDSPDLLVGMLIL